MTIAEQIRQEAKATTTEKIALKLIDEGLDVMTIVRSTDLSPQAVEQLQQKRRGS